MNPLMTFAINTVLKDINKNGANSKYLKKFGGPILNAASKATGVNIPGVSNSSTSGSGASGSNINIDDYTRGLGEFIGQDIVVPLLGDAAKVIGGTMSAKNSLLGDALASMKFNSDSPFARYGLDIKSGAAPLVAGLKARGDIAALTGNTVGNRLQAIADASKADTLMKNNMRYQADVKPSGGFWDQMGRVTKLNNSSTLDTKTDGAK